MIKNNIMIGLFNKDAILNEPYTVAGANAKYSMLNPVNSPINFAAGKPFLLLNILNSHF